MVLSLGGILIHVLMERLHQRGAKRVRFGGRAFWRLVRDLQGEHIRVVIANFDVTP